MNRANSRLRGLLATLALVGFVVGVPVVLVVIDALPDPSAFTWSRLTSQDDGTLALQVITAVCWVAWAVFTCQLVASAVSQLRGIRTPRLPGLAVPQFAADRLVAAAALLFVAVPAVSGALPQPRAHAAVAAPLPDAPQVAVDIESSVPPRAEDRFQAVQPETERYTVKRGDSLWKIAEERLGDGTRYVELVALNKAVLDGRPDFLLPGTVLRIPIATASSDSSYVVQPGDTLSEISEEHLGDADAYPSIFRASRDKVQANGARLSDPDLILPGWKLTIPGQPAPAEPQKPKHVQEPPLGQTPPPTDAPTPPAPDVADPAPDQADPESAKDETVPSWLLPGLAGAGSILGASVWLTLRARRRTQLRFRRPGSVIPPPPAELLPVDKTVHVTASATAPRIESLDAALRHLDPVPQLIKATLSDTELALTLSEPATLPAPWCGSACEWSIALEAVPERPENAFPPYPLLVSIGRTADGTYVFLNLEELRLVSVTGDETRKAAFARHVAAELAVNPWSSVVTQVDVLGLGSDLAMFAGRVHTHPVGDTAFIAHLANDLAGIDDVPEVDDFHAVIVAKATRPESDLARLSDTIGSAHGRSSAVLIDLNCASPGTAALLDISPAGLLCAPSLGIEVAAAGLSEEEARACAVLLDLALEEAVSPVPRHDDVEATSDLGGALIEELTEPRPLEGAAGAGALLARSAETYADAAATTVDDIAVVAPLASKAAERVVAAVDPDLGEDLARWESPVPLAPKLTLLGPVGARTLGDTKATAHRRPFYVELLAYLFLHPKGATSAEIAEAFNIKPERVRVDMTQLRQWLGKDPHTGSLYLPNAAAASRAGSPSAYRVQGILCDLDLFRRLRARGQSRGADGISDLVAALGMVTGEPFSDLRDGHWAWLLDGDRWDQIMTSAIADVGHIVCAHALAESNPGLALWAAQVAHTAAPFDEVAQLDLIQAEKTAGENEQAREDLDRRVWNRRDDELPPVATPKRTVEVARQKGWSGARQGRRRTG